jgi:putative membrane protein
MDVKLIPAIAGLAGFCLAGWLLYSLGIGHVLALFARAGWLGLSAVIAFHLVEVAFSAAAWHSISASAGRRPGLAGYLVLRLVREGVNNLLPVAQVGGQVAATRLLQRQGMALPEAIATTVADLTLEMITQILFTMLGLVLLLQTVGGQGVASAVVAGLIGATAAVGGFVGAQWFGLGHVLEWAVLRLGGRLGWDGTAHVAGLQKALRACYRMQGAVLGGIAWHATSWLLGGVEVCLALHVLGHGVNFSTGLVIESLGQALKTAGFAVPGALGVQEGGYILICGLFNVPPEAAIALSLTKRLREIVLGLPALAAWHGMERRAPRFAATAVPDGLS